MLHLLKQGYAWPQEVTGGGHLVSAIFFLLEICQRFVMWCGMEICQEIAICCETVRYGKEPKHRGHSQVFGMSVDDL